MVPTLSEIYHYMCVSLFNFMKDKRIEDHAEIMEDFFGMLFRYVKYIPSVIFSSETLEINLQLAESTIGKKKLPDLTRALYFFLEIIFKNCNLNPQDDVEKVRQHQVILILSSLLLRSLWRNMEFVISRD